MLLYTIYILYAIATVANGMMQARRTPSNRVIQQDDIPVIKKDYETEQSGKWIKQLNANGFHRLNADLGGMNSENSLLIKFRPLIRSNLKYVERLHELSFVEEFEEAVFYQSSFGAWLQDNAEDDTMKLLKGLVAYIAITDTPLQFKVVYDKVLKHGSDRYVYVAYLATLRRYNNQKIGKILSQKVISYYRSLHPEKLGLFMDVEQRNEKAKKIYASWGFKKVGEYYSEDQQIVVEVHMAIWSELWIPGKKDGDNTRLLAKL